MLTLCRVLGAGLLLACLGKLIAVRSAELKAAPQPGGLAFGLEIWAALMTAGEPIINAVSAAATCSAPEPATVLHRVAEGLTGGLSSAEAWSAALAGLDSPVWELAAQACVRSERDGTPLAPALRRLAAEERAGAASRGVIAARRAGVLAVLPLGLCTLPAYVLLSVAPAVIGLVDRAL